MKPHLMIATGNRHKTHEFSQLLGDKFEISDFSSLDEIPEIDESGATFAENACIKALAISQKFSGLVIADDSGLEVDALQGEPGVRSARYAGPQASDAANRQKLLKSLQALQSFFHDFPTAARFQCVIAVAHQGKILTQCHGTVEGDILLEERGDQGFGYDPLFLPKGYHLSFAELPLEEKNKISHRAHATIALLQFLESFSPTT